MTIPIPEVGFANGITAVFAADALLAADRAVSETPGDEYRCELTIPELDNATRHMLSINDEGDYTLTHQLGELPHPAQLALDAFMTLLDDAGHELAHRVDAGFYWCSVDTDGNFEIGSRVA